MHANLLMSYAQNIKDASIINILGKQYMQRIKKKIWSVVIVFTMQL